MMAGLDYDVGHKMKTSKQKIKLQPLRISAGWTITYNTFYEVEPVEGKEVFFDGLSLLMLNNDSIRKIIDLEWRPERDINGSYILRVINYIEHYNSKKTEYEKIPDWENLHMTFSSKSRLEMVSKLEELMPCLPVTQDERILEKRGMVSQPSESFRLELLENGLTSELISKVIDKGNSKIQTLLLDHPDINREILQLFLEKGKNKRIRNKASQKLLSKQFKK